jgi:hypothetical protein
MTQIPSGTKFIGISSNVPVPENRSSLSNSYQEVYTIDDIIAEASAADTNIYNSDGTLDGNRTVNLNSNSVAFNNGNFGIGVTPTAKLHIRKEAQAGGENIAKFEVSDDLSSFLEIANQTGTNNLFLPMIRGIQGANYNALSLIGQGTTDTGSEALIVLDSRISNSAATVRPLCQWANYGSSVMILSASGNLGIGTTTPSEKLDVNGKTKTATLQVTSGAAANRYLASDASGNGSWVALPTEIQAAASDETTALTTGTAKVTFRMPYAMTLTAVRASLSTAQASGSIFTVDINEGGTSVLSTKLTIDNTEKTSTTAATAAVISDSALADDAEITIDIDQIGNGTAKGLKVTLIGTRV